MFALFVPIPWAYIPIYSTSKHTCPQCCYAGFVLTYPVGLYPHIQYIQTYMSAMLLCWLCSYLSRGPTSPYTVHPNIHVRNVVMLALFLPIPWAYIPIYSTSKHTCLQCCYVCFERTYPVVLYPHIQYIQTYLSVMLCLLCSYLSLRPISPYTVHPNIHVRNVVMLALFLPIPWAYIPIYSTSKHTRPQCCYAGFVRTYPVGLYPHIQYIQTYMSAMLLCWLCSYLSRGPISPYTVHPNIHVRNVVVCALLWLDYQSGMF